MRKCPLKCVDLAFRFDFDLLMPCEGQKGVCNEYEIPLSIMSFFQKCCETEAETNWKVCLMKKAGWGCGFMFFVLGGG
jgi:hypothetical protein